MARSGLVVRCLPLDANILGVERVSALLYCNVTRILQQYSMRIYGTKMQQQQQQEHVLIGARGRRTTIRVSTRGHRENRKKNSRRGTNRDRHHAQELRALWPQQYLCSSESFA